MRVLIVEDQPNVSNYVKRALEEQGYAVDLARTGREALDWAEVVKFDLISISANKYRPLKHILITGDIARKWSNYDSHARGQ